MWKNEFGTDRINLYLDAVNCTEPAVSTPISKENGSTVFNGFILNPSAAKLLQNTFHKSSDRFYFGFAIQDPKTYEFILDESIYTIDSMYKIATRQEDGTIKWESYPVELESCELTKFPKSYQEMFAKRKVENMYCVKNFTYSIEGTFLYDKYSFLPLKLSNNTFTKDN